MINDSIIITLAFPDTIVRISDENLVSYLRFIGIGTKNYVRAGHAALVLIKKSTGNLEYFDFGRYTTPQGYGRVRGKITDYELDFNLVAKINEGKLENLDEIIKFFATNPKLTHGEGRMVTSVCNQINYKSAKNFILNLQNQGFVRYGAFIKNGTNCSRFVTDTLIASVTDATIKKRLINSKWFTPSTVGNVLLSNTEDIAFKVCEKGNVSKYEGSKQSENFRCFLDKLKEYQPNSIGNLKPKYVDGIHEKAQWLEGIGAGAWFELFATSDKNIFKYRRISPYGNVDVEGLYQVNDTSFLYNEAYEFIHLSNCKFFHIKQKNKVFRFNKVKVNSTNLMQKEHLI